VDENFEKKTENSGTTGSYLQKRIAELQSIIRGKEEELINYGKNHEILSLDASQNTVVERLNGLSKQLLEAENERKIAEAAYKASTRPGALEALAEAGGSDRDVPSSTRVITEAEIKLTELKQKRAELLVENKETWPAVKEVDKQIAALNKQISDTRSRATSVVSSNLLTRYQQALSAEGELRKAYEKQRAETLTQNEAAVSYRIIQQEIDTNKTLLDGLLQRTKENEVVMAGTPNNVRVVDYAISGRKPVSPRRTLIVGLSVMLSLGLGIGLAFFIEYLDDSVRSPDDIERWLHLPSIAMIPQVGAQKQKRLGTLTAKKDALATNGNGVREVLLTEVDKRSAIAEAYRHLRTSILLSTAGRPPKSLLITSSVPSEGKTTTAVNTAISLAQTGGKVLLIDADMRRPRVHSIFNLSNATGLSALLSRDVEDDDITAAIQREELSGLYVLTAGPVPPNPAELIGSDQMLKLLSRLTPRFTHVVVDSPPVAAFTDGVLIGAMVDAVLLVVHSGKSSRKVVARARRLLQDVGARIIGVVLNKVETSGSHSYYYYSGYYSHYHYGADASADTQGVGV
jgi:capsular exopolysaccharide synthesis family protein